MQFHYYVYIIECSDGTFYTGVSNNYERRYKEHCEGINPGCYTYDRRPLRLRHVEWYHDITQAIAREKQLKGWGKKKKEALIAGDFKTLSFEALGYERRVFPPLNRDQRT